MRISKAMARAGLCSRRDAERWIEEGRVELNGQTLTSPAQDVGPNDRIFVDGQPLPGAEPTRLWRYAKPKGRVTTHRDPEGRPTVFDDLPADMPRVLTIGRLDYNTEGLLLLTTDGELARYLELPTTGWLRRYRVRAHGEVNQAALDELKEGVVIDRVAYGPVEATLDSQQGSNVWLTLGLREGKNREVRKILASLGLEVNRLIRVSFGPFQLLDLKPGTVEPVRRRALIEQLGVKVAKRFEFGDDDGGEAPIAARQPRARPDRHGDRHGARDEQEHATPRSDRSRQGRPRPEGGRSERSQPESRQSETRRSERSGQGRVRPERRDRQGARASKAAIETIEVDETKLDDIKPWSASPREDGAGRVPKAGNAERFGKAGRRTAGARKGGPQTGRRGRTETPDKS